MDQNRTELEKKIVAAGSPEEIERILNDAGEKITAEEAQQLFEKVKSRRTFSDACMSTQFCNILHFSRQKKTGHRIIRKPVETS